ncbi:MAG: hypothetical protein ACP5G1_02230 [Nanopusillaceae archaeon]
MVVRRLVWYTVIDELRVRIELYETERVRYVMLRDIDTGRFIRKPNYVLIRMIKTGQYPASVVRIGKGAHPFWMEISYEKTIPLGEFINSLLPIHYGGKGYDLVSYIQHLYDEWENELKAVELDLLLNELYWDARDMIESPFWINSLKGYELEFSDEEVEEYELLRYGH